MADSALRRPLSAICSGYRTRLLAPSLLSEFSHIWGKGSSGSHSRFRPCRPPRHSRALNNSRSGYRTRPRSTLQLISRRTNPRRGRKSRRRRHSRNLLCLLLCHNPISSPARSKSRRHDFALFRKVALWSFPLDHIGQFFGRRHGGW